jgi:hypothetical protein
MKKRTYVCGFAALASLFLIGSLMQSRESQAKGAYSTPVTVMNTTSNTVPSLDWERVSRIPYESTAQPQGNCPNGTGIQQCVFSSFTAPPSGFRLAVEKVSGGSHCPPPQQVRHLSC